MKILTFLSLSFIANAAQGDNRQNISVPKSEWISHIETALPVYACRPKSELRVCFAVDAQECEDGMASATRVCAKSIDTKIPDSVSNEVGTNLGGEIGECATNAFAVLHEKDQRDTSDCKAAISAAQEEMTRDTEKRASKQVAADRTTSSASAAACEAAKNHTNRIEYPQASLAEREHGKVIVKIHVGKTGNVEEVGLVKSSHYPRLDERAVAGAYKWTFDATACGGIWLLRSIDFSTSEN